MSDFLFFHLFAFSLAYVLAVSFLRLVVPELQSPNQLAKFLEFFLSFRLAYGSGKIGLCDFIYQVLENLS